MISMNSERLLNSVPLERLAHGVDSKATVGLMVVAKDAARSPVAFLGNPWMPPYQKVSIYLPVLSTANSKYGEALPFPVNKRQINVLVWSYKKVFFCSIKMTRKHLGKKREGIPCLRFQNCSTYSIIIQSLRIPKQSAQWGGAIP